MDLTARHRLSGVDTETATATCSVCGPTRIKVHTAGGHECWTVRQAQNRRRKRKPANRAAKREAWLKSTYGITTVEYKALLEAQGGGCAICGVERCEGGSLAVDHCHSTGTVRGLLCGRCNRAIGLFEDDTLRLGRAITYLQSHPNF